MDFAFDETQRDIRELAERVLRRVVEDGARADNEDRCRRDATTEAWTALAEADLLSLAVPEEFGGAGLGAVESAVVLTEVGRRANSIPTLPRLAVSCLAGAVLPVVRFGTGEQRAELLKGADSGRVLTSALNEPSAPLPAAPTTSARRENDVLVLSDRKIGVVGVESAHRMLVSVTVAGEGPGLAVVDPGADGVSSWPTRTSSGAVEHTVMLDEVRIAATELLGGGSGQRILDRTHDYAIAGACALAHGCVAGALDLTKEHVGTREQFGRPLASFQAVAGQIADVYIAARTSGLATWAASWALTRDTAEAANGLEEHESTADLSVREECEIAACWLTESAPQALRTCQHLHGGTGVDVTYPLHQYFSLVRDVVRYVGGEDACLDRLVAAAS